MNSRLHFVLGAGLAALAAGFAAAADEPPKPEMYFVYIEHVKPSMLEEYEAAVKNLVNEFKTYEIDPEKVGFWTVSGPELGYAYVMPIENFAGMDAMMEHWHGAVEKIGEERWEEMSEKTNAAIQSSEGIVSMRRPELSYVPEKPALEQEDIKFISYSYYHAIPGKEAALEEVAKKYAALYKKHGIDVGWSVYQGVMGSDLPVYVIARPARSQSEYFTQSEEEQQLLGEEGQKLGLEAMKCVRKVRRMEGWVRRDLSYPGE